MNPEVPRLQLQKQLWNVVSLLPDAFVAGASRHFHDRPLKALEASGDEAFVHLVLRASTGDPAFLHSSLGGWCKGTDPSVSIERLGDEWVPGAHVVYIGKADYRSRRRPIEGLRKRLWEFARFGAGETIGHRGGRLIWQLADSAELLVAWHEVTWDETARDYEKRLLHHFANLNSGRRPFANLTG